jgi:hypothetical protein
LGFYEYFDVLKIPAIVKLLDSDYRTIVESKKLLIKAKNMSEIEAVIIREAKALVDNWLHPDFPKKVKKFMIKLQKEKEAKRKAKL